MTRQPKCSRREAGVGLVTAIFLLVVLAGLGVAMVSIFTSQRSAANLDLQGARAYQAARAGLEWGMFQQMRNGSCPKDPVVMQMPGGTSLAGFTVIVSCKAQASGDQALFLITSTACNFPDATGCGPPNNPEAVRRQLEVQL